MKINRRTVLSTAAVLGVAALIAGGTIAYFKDTEKTDNNFTVGNVNIELYESQLHRMNSGRTGTFSALASDADYCDYTVAQTNPDGRGDMLTYDKAKYCTPGIDANQSDGISAIKEGHITARSWGYSDATIIADAEKYKATDDASTTDKDESGYFTRTSQNLVPGQWVRKFAYAKNVGESDAFILIRYMVPQNYAEALDIEVPHTPYGDGNDHYFTAVKKENGSYVATDAETSYTERIDGVDYVVYAAVTTDVVKSGEMTFWSPVNALRLKTSEAQNDAGNGSNDVSYARDAAFSVKVDAQAIQAKTFSDAIDAINHL